MFDDVEEVIDAYVYKMRESGNTDITADYILNEVHEKNITDGDGNVITKGDQTVTYDKLIYAWRDHDLNDALATIDTAYCRYVLDTFNSCTGACGEPAAAPTNLHPAVKSRLCSRGGAGCCKFHKGNVGQAFRAL